MLGIASLRQGPASMHTASAEESDSARRQGKARLASRRPREAARGAVPVQACEIPTERQTPPHTARERVRGANRTKGERMDKFVWLAVAVLLLLAAAGFLTAGVAA